MKDKILKLLQENPQYRDDLRALVAKIWADELVCDGMDFILQYKLGQITSESTISRLWRHIQETEPHLRGSKWEERHNRAEIIRKSVIEVVCYHHEK